MERKEGNKGAGRWLISGGWRSREEAWSETGQKAIQLEGGSSTETILRTGAWNIENECMISGECQALLKVPFGFLPLFFVLAASDKVREERDELKENFSVGKQNLEEMWKS